MVHLSKADEEDIRHILSRFFPSWKIDQILAERCPYCGCTTPRSYKIYRHPKDLDCIGIYTCDDCGKQWVKEGEVHTEVW